MQSIATPDFSTDIQNLLDAMTLPEKIGQMTQVEKNSITPEDVTQYFIGSILSGGGGNPTPNTMQSWAAMVRDFLEAAQQTRLKIPLVYGVDAVHGHNNVKGATIFPHNIGLGAANDEDLVERIAEMTATEILATNVHWTFAPEVSVPQDIRWGRTFEGYSENREIVSRLGAAHVRGLQKPSGQFIRALASVKHFVGDGGTTWGTTSVQDWIQFVWQSPDDRWSIDQGDTRIDEQTLRDLHLYPYLAAMDASALNIMVSYNSWNGDKMHGHKYLLTDVLKEALGFKGFLVTDWMAIDQLEPDFYNCVVRGINAGIDMVMVPFDYKRFIAALTEAVEKGDVSQSRIDDAVNRILLAKFALGLFDQPIPDSEHRVMFGAADHRAVAREAVRKSLVLLKNENALPVQKSEPLILVGGYGADDIGRQCGGWSIEWMGKTGDTTDGTTILEGIRAAVDDQTQVVYSTRGMFDRHAPVGIAVVGELPYAEGEGDRADLSLSAEDKRLIERMRRRCDKLILVIVSGRPLMIADEIKQVDACVAAWLPGTEANGVADVLFGDYPFVGRLPYTWARTMEQVPHNSNTGIENPLFPFGFGLEA